MNRLVLAMSVATIGLLAFATPSLSSEPIRLCTGSEDGVYYEIGTILKRWSKNQPIEVIPTEGSVDNIERVIKGECDAFIAQPDALNYAAITTPRIKKLFRSVGSLHREYLHVVCGRDSGIDDLSDLEGTEKKLNLGPPNSGAWVTWQNLVKEDSGYETIKTESDPHDLALSSVSAGDIDCMLVASGLRSGPMLSADENYGDSLVLVGANDKDFNDAVSVDGKPLYTYSKISEYPNINNGWSSPSTISWNAQVYANTDTLDSKRLSQFAQTIAKTRGEIVGRWGK